MFCSLQFHRPCSLTLQTPISSSIIAHSGTDDKTNSVNLEQIQSAISPKINSNNNLNHPSSDEKVENILDNISNHSATILIYTRSRIFNTLNHLFVQTPNHQKIRKLMIFRIGYIKNRLVTK